MSSTSGQLPEIIKNNLRHLRLEMGLRRDDFAKVVSVHPNTVSNWETGSAVPSIDTLDAVAMACGVDTDLLVSRHYGAYYIGTGQADPNSAFLIPVAEDVLPDRSLPIEKRIVPYSTKPKASIPHEVARHHPNAFLYRVVDSSCSALFRADSYVLIDVSAPIDPKSNSICLVKVDGGPAVLRAVSTRYRTVTISTVSIGEEDSSVLTMTLDDFHKRVDCIGRAVWDTVYDDIHY